jgi:hypothetical protein
MNIDALRAVDRVTASGILAAAALASAPNPGIGERPLVLRRYEREAEQVLSEIRGRLKVSPNTDAYEASVSKIIADALQQAVLSQTNKADVLARVGAAGNLAPVAYNVIQTNHFGNTFYGLGTTRNHVEDAVKHPDDFQHLLTEGVPENHQDISLFMKRVESRSDALKNRWLLVQTHRVGIDQKPSAAWLVYPDEVEIGSARKPIDVLKAFVEVYGVPFSIGELGGFFIASEIYPGPPPKVLKVTFDGNPKDRFVSFSNVTTPVGEIRIGVAYCIDLRKYRGVLKAHGAKVVEPSVAGGVSIETTTTTHVLDYAR